MAGMSELSADEIDEMLLVWARRRGLQVDRREHWDAVATRALLIDSAGEVEKFSFRREVAPGKLPSALDEALKQIRQWAAHAGHEWLVGSAGGEAESPR